MAHSTRRQALRIAAAATVGLPLMARRVAAASHAITHTVTIKDFAFSPAELTISAGDTVMFMNEDSAPHTATADGGAFDTGRLSRGQSAGLTFPSAGSFPYSCTIHPRMKALITVA